LNKDSSQYLNNGPTLQKQIFSRESSKKILSCTNAGSINKTGFYSKRNSGTGAVIKPQGAPAKQMSGRFNVKQNTVRQLGNSSSTNSFRNINAGSGPIGPRGGTFKNSQCII